MKSQRRGIRRFIRPVMFGLVVVAGGAAGFLFGSSSPGAPTEHVITVRASQYGYDPPVIRVNRGDTLRLRLLATDVTHGFYLEGYDIEATMHPLEPGIWLRHPSRPAEAELVEEVVFTATREGKFRYRCSQTCGYMHPFMLGELVVQPNRLFPTSVGITLGILLGGLLTAPKRTSGQW